MAQTTKAPARKRPAKAAAAPAVAPEPEPAAEPEPATGFRWRGPTIFFIVIAVLASLTAMRLGAQQRGGPAQTFASVHDVPATLYLPEKMHNGRVPNPKPVGQRPPLVVVAH